MNPKTIKIISLVSMIGGAIISIVGDYAQREEMRNEIAKQVEEQLLKIGK